MGKAGVRSVAVAYDGMRDIRGAGGVRWRLLNVLLVAADCFFIGMQVGGWWGRGGEGRRMVAVAMHCEVRGMTW